MSSWIEKSSAPNKRIRRSNRIIRRELVQTLSDNVAVAQWLFCYLSETGDYITLFLLSETCSKWTELFREMYNYLIPKWQVKTIKKWSNIPYPSLYTPLYIGTELRWAGKLHSTPDHPSLRLTNSDSQFCIDVYCRYGRVIKIVFESLEIHGVFYANSKGMLYGKNTTTHTGQEALVAPAIVQWRQRTGNPNWHICDYYLQNQAYDFGSAFWLPVDQGKFEEKKLSELK